jgi:hypothetical protein
MSNYWVRVKPLNPKRGHVVGRIHCLGRLWRGGDGIEQIPEWVEVNKAQAEALMDFQQSDRDPYSPRVFDIVTPELRRQIDQKENDFRMSVLGRGQPITAMPDVTAPEASLVDGQATRRRVTLEDLASGQSDEAVGGIADADKAPAPRQPRESSALPEPSTPAADLAGRAAAAEGFEDTLDMNDGEDDGDDDGDDEAEAASAASLPAPAPPPPAPKPARPPKTAKVSKAASRRRRGSK